MSSIKPIQEAIDEFINSKHYLSPSAVKVASIFKQHQEQVDNYSALHQQLLKMKDTIEKREGTGILYRRLYRCASFLLNGFTHGSFRSSHAITEDLLSELESQNQLESKLRLQVSNELLESSHDPKILEGASRQTMLKVMRASQEIFVMIPKKPIVEGAGVQPDAQDLWVRKTAHRIEVWKRDSVKEPCLVDRIQNVRDKSIKYIKHVKHLDDLTDFIIEKENLQSFAEVGISLEGAVQVEGVDAGFVMESAKNTYADRFNKPPTQEKLDEEAKELCTLMDKMHEIGTHNDIKPENIIEREDGSLRFIDFLGARKKGEDVTNIAMTPAYVSKKDFDNFCEEKNKQLQDISRLDTLAKAIDIHQMGVTLYLRAIGKGIEDSNFPYEIKQNYPEEALKEPLFPEGCAVSPELQQLIRAMLTQDPDERIALYDQKKYFIYKENL